MITVNPLSCVANDQSFTNGPAAVTFATLSTSAYPSTISVSLPAGQVVGKLKVTINGLTENISSHDVSVLLVDPNGNELEMMTGAGNVAISTPIDSITFDDSATSLLPQSGSLSSGIFRPTDYSASDFSTISGGPVPPYPEPAPRGPATFESQFGGTNPNGNWKLYIVDSTTGATGSITGWSLDITPAYAASNPASISFTAGPPLNTTPYPSAITVSGLPGNIDKLTLMLNGLTDICPAVDGILLQGPQGQLLVPFSGVGECGSTVLNHGTIVLGDDAATLMPQAFHSSATLTAGFFQPTSDYAAPSPFQPHSPLDFSPLGGPAGPYLEPAMDGIATFKSAFQGKDPNGIWNLYLLVQDGLGQLMGFDSGSLAGGWGLRFELQCASCNTSVTASTGTASSFNQPVTFNGSASSDFEGPPGGSVTFCDGAAANGVCTGSNLGTVLLDGSGNASLPPISTLAVGPHTITLNYPGSGDKIYPATTSPPLNFTVSPAATTMSLTSSANPSVFGQSVTFDAAVTPAFGGSPTGTVTFMDGGNALGAPVMLSSGAAALVTSSLTAGTHNITASYSGDTNFAGSSVAMAAAQVVNKADTLTADLSSLNPSTYGTDVTFTATVTSTAGTPTGTVTFKDGATVLGTSTISVDKATFSSNALAVGSHSITATYNGAGDYNTSGSSTLTQTVGQQSTTMEVISSKPSGAFYGQSITFTASVSALPTGPSVPGGTVTFMDGATTLGTGTLSSQTASLTCAPGNACGPLNVGSHSITAVYGGDGNYTGSTSSSVTQTVKQTATTSAISSSVNPSSFGQSVTFTATVTSAVNGVFPDGTVTLCDGAVILGACTGTALGTPTLNSSGVAMLAIANLQTGSHTINALYDGSSNFNASDSTGAPMVQTVSKAATITTLTVKEMPAYVQPTQDLFRHQITLTAAVTSSGGIPGCTVTFMDNGVALSPAMALSDGKASLTVVLGKIGLHPITAVYNGCANFNASSSAVLNEYRSPKGH